MRAALACLVLCSCATPRGQSRASDTPEQVADALWEEFLRAQPIRATFLGDRRYDGELPDISEAAQAAFREMLERYRRRVRALPALSGQSRVTAQVLAVLIDDTLEVERCQRETWDVDQLAGYQVSLNELGSFQLVDSPQAAAAYVSRMAQIDALFDQHLDNLKRGLAQGRTAPRVVVERVIAQLAGLLAAPARESPLLAVMPRVTGLTDADKERLAADIVAVVEHGVRPAMARYHAFLRDTYLGQARTAVGVAANPEGALCYEALIKSHTGEIQSPDQIHQIGLDELGRLHAQMNAIAKRAGHTDFRAYAAALKASPEQYLPSSDALIEHNLRLVRRAEAELPRAFGRLAPWSVGVKAIEAFRAADAPAAYYYSAADDGSRPAYYYLNTHNPQTRPLYNMEALAYHEAVPGHHLQIAIAQSLGDLPALRRHSDFTAFVEGWGLYAELVADELGLYSSEATRFGMLNFQAWRAARLVVDTGMHALGWSREQALQFFRDNLLLPEGEAANEIDRYIIWPGQALAY
ncbi:MAG: DUF885 domain-containing protein, partial [Deltaproteobacteria bacterium]|nr:DUF885 domain-containing protein [Deltaproteobacteria bacterium]